MNARTLNSYDRILVAFSGGKDSEVCVCDLKDRGVDMRKVEVHHHAIDGAHGEESFMDWPCTPAYCAAFAKEFGLTYYSSWKEGGFKREMMRRECLTAPTSFETPDGFVITVGGKTGKPNTRMRFPQVSANLSVRWCSAYLKIMVMDALINNQARFLHGKTLVITGERAQESTARAKYETFEPHRTDNRDGKKVKRHIDHWRPVHGWGEEKVWETLERHDILPHPAYRLSWGRLSCMACIFGSDRQWASVNHIDPKRFELMAGLEEEFGCTIHRTKTLSERIQNAKPYEDMDPALIKEALSVDYRSPIKTLFWELPKGAYGDSAGPT